MVSARNGSISWASAAGPATDIRLAEPRRLGAKSAPRHVATIGARRPDFIASQGMGGKPARDLWEAVGHFEMSVRGLASRWALVGYVREIDQHLNAVSDATERSTRERSPKALVALRDQLTRTTLDGRVVINDIAQFAEDERSWQWDLMDFEEVLPQRLAESFQGQGSLAEAPKVSVNRSSEGGRTLTRRLICVSLWPPAPR